MGPEDGLTDQRRCQKLNEAIKNTWTRLDLLNYEFSVVKKLLRSKYIYKMYFKKH